MSPETEDRFRLWAFRIFYRRTFRGEVDPALRFGKALEASSRVIVHPERLREWERQYGGLGDEALLDEATVPDAMIAEPVEGPHAAAS